MVILSSTKIKDAIDKYPELRDFLINLSPKFKKLKNTVIFSLVSRWATFYDAAKLSGLSICELLHSVNSFIGKEDELLNKSPDCLKKFKDEFSKEEEEIPEPEWLKNSKRIIQIDVRERDDFFFQEIFSTIKRLKKDELLLIINSFKPSPLINIVNDLGYEYYLKTISNNEFHLYIKGKEVKVLDDWTKIKDTFETIDVRGWREDPFSEILKKANETPPGHGFKIIQYFLPQPLINMLKPLGFDVFIEKRSPIEHHVYFYRIEKPSHKKRRSGDKIPLIIQSATPVVYPIVMRLLQSKNLMDRIKIEDLKIWDKTEKHLGWIMSGKADISFSAVAAVSKIFEKGLDIKMKAIIVWDNFFILTRDYIASDFNDIKGKKIYLPLIKAAPTYAVTSFLMKSYGYSTEDFEFVFGEPFGRPGDIKDMLIKGKIDTALLREPEASFAIYEGEGRIKESISYKTLWEKLFPSKGNLPNAGILFKGEILREEPELLELFLKETEKAIEWVNNSRNESASIIYDIMGIEKEEAELFLKRATFKFKPSREVFDTIINYITVLNKSGYGKKEFGDLRELFL